MREESTDESERRRPRLWRLIVAAVLLLLALVVLGAAVRYSGRGHPAAVDQDTKTTDLAPAAADTDAPAVSAAPVDTPASMATSPTSPPPPALSSPSAGPAPTTTRTAATKAATKTATKASTTAPTKAFTPITVQAEASTSTLSGGAAKVDCGTCRAGARVRYLGRVDIHTTVPVSGTRTITFAYEADGTRSFDVSINGGPPVTTLTVTGTDWTTPRSITVTTSIPAGSVDIGFYEDAGNPPDLDAVTIS